MNKVINTFFKLPRRLWKSPANDQGNIVGNQIDFILINKRFQNSTIFTKTYPGADISSDHNLLIATMKLKLKKLMKKDNRITIDTRKVQHKKTTVTITTK